MEIGPESSISETAFAESLADQISHSINSEFALPASAAQNSMISASYHNLRYAYEMRRSGLIMRPGSGQRRMMAICVETMVSWIFKVDVNNQRASFRGHRAIKPLMHIHLICALIRLITDRIIQRSWIEIAM